MSVAQAYLEVFDAKEPLKKALEPLSRDLGVERIVFCAVLEPEGFPACEIRSESGSIAKVGLIDARDGSGKKWNVDVSRVRSERKRELLREAIARALRGTKHGLQT